MDEDVGALHGARSPRFAGPVQLGLPNHFCGSSARKIAEGLFYRTPPRRNSSSEMSGACALEANTLPAPSQLPIRISARAASSRNSGRSDCRVACRICSRVTQSIGCFRRWVSVASKVLHNTAGCRRQRREPASRGSSQASIRSTLRNATKNCPEHSNLPTLFMNRTTRSETNQLIAGCE